MISAAIPLLRNYDERLDRTLAPDTTAFATQLLHHRATLCRIKGNELQLDFSGLQKLSPAHRSPAHRSPAHWQQSFSTKIQSPTRLQFVSEGVEISNASTHATRDAVVHTLTIRAQKTRATIAWDIGTRS